MANPKFKNGHQGFLKSEEAMKSAHQKSAEVRKANNAKRRAMKEQFDVLLKCKLHGNSNVRKALKKMGIEDEEMVNQMSIVYNMFIEASKGKGSSAVSAATFIRDTLGEKPRETQINVQTDFESYISSLESDEEF